MKQNIVEKKKVFGGETEFIIDYSTSKTLAESKRNRHFNQRMLRAYIKGKTEFNFGFENYRDMLGRIVPKSYPVLVKFI